MYQSVSRPPPQVSHHDLLTLGFDSDSARCFTRLLMDLRAAVSVTVTVPLYRDAEEFTDATERNSRQAIWIENELGSYAFDVVTPVRLRIAHQIPRAATPGIRFWELDARVDLEPGAIRPHKGACHCVVVGIHQPKVCRESNIACGTVDKNSLIQRIHRNVARQGCMKQSIVIEAECVLTFFILSRKPEVIHNLDRKSVV